MLWATQYTTNFSEIRACFDFADLFKRPTPGTVFSQLSMNKLHFLSFVISFLSFLMLIQFLLCKENFHDGNMQFRRSCCRRLQNHRQTATTEQRLRTGAQVMCGRELFINKSWMIHSATKTFADIHCSESTWNNSRASLDTTGG